MFSLNIKPKKENNNQPINISNNDEENNGVLLIDLKTINLENISVELALNVLQLKHATYYEMNQSDIIQYYNNKMKLTNNINTILALKIILKSKLKGLDLKINNKNGIMFSNREPNNNTSTNITTNNYDTLNIEKKIKAITSTSTNNDDFRINQVQKNNFKIIQNKVSQDTNKNLVEFKNTSQNFYPNQLNNSQTNNLQTNNSQTNKVNQFYLPTSSNQTNSQTNSQSNQANQANQANQFYLPSSSNQINSQTNQFYLPTSSNQTYPISNQFNTNQTNNEKINNIPVINSSEFDINSIINSFTQKKNQGFIK